MLVLFYHDFFIAEDVDARSEATVGGGAWLYIQDANELACGAVYLELRVVAALDAHTMACDRTDDEVIAVRGLLAIVLVHLWYDLVDGSAIGYLDDGGCG